MTHKIVGHCWWWFHNFTTMFVLLRFASLDCWISNSWPLNPFVLSFYLFQTFLSTKYSCLICMLEFKHSSRCMIVHFRTRKTINTHLQSNRQFIGTCMLFIMYMHYESSAITTNCTIIYTSNTKYPSSEYVTLNIYCIYLCATLWKCVSVYMCSCFDYIIF